MKQVLNVFDVDIYEVAILYSPIMNMIISKKYA